MKKILFLLYFFSSLTFATQDTYLFTAQNDAKRFAMLTSEIRCLVCQNQNIADSNAPLANDLREKIYRMVQEKKSDEEIKTYLVKRYGEFILLNPRLTSLTFFLWGFPFVSLFIIVFLVYRYIHEQQRL